LCGGVDGPPDRRRPPQSRPDGRARRSGRLAWRGGDLRRGVPDRHHRGTARVTRLEGKIALVTGTQQGIGRSIAVALSRASADVALPAQALVGEVVADPGLRTGRTTPGRVILCPGGGERVGSWRHAGQVP